MGLTRSQMDAALKELYDQIPDIPDCTGQCWISCGPIDMSDRERQRIRRAGFEITPINDARIMDETYYCEALTGGKRCAVYDIRPLVCRLWGASEGLRCPYGCIPAGGWISNETAYRLIVESGMIGGHQYAVPDSPRVRALMASEWFRTAMHNRLAIGSATDGVRVEGQIPPGFRRKNNGR